MTALLMHTTAQGLITELVSSVFQIESGYFGTVLSNLAKVRVEVGVVMQEATNNAILG